MIGYSTHLVAACDLPEDRSTRWSRPWPPTSTDLAAINKAIDGLTPKVMAVDIGVPFHKGAAKFYKEVGAM